MDTQEVLLRAIHESPGDELAWAALADWLEEEGQDDRAELLRLDLALRRAPPGKPRLAAERRLQALVRAGVRPCVPLITNSVGMQFALVPAGTFLMGSPPGEEGRYDDEGPQHRVTLPRSYYLGVSSVTQEQWQAVTGHNYSRFKGRLRPVDNVSWEHCQDFCERLGKLDGRRYRLPTEAEWEHACRAGTTSPFSFGEVISTELANYDGNCTYGGSERGLYRRMTTRVGSFPPNAWGLFDMHGNVKEWCADWIGDYDRRAAVDPQGLPSGIYRVQRGGSWFNIPRFCRSAMRRGSPPPHADNESGLRLCLERA
jgi:uncharacterized protein (TIGR02996 family)